MPRTDDILLIAGVPAAGKSHFCAWLAHTHGYLHIDYENQLAQLREGPLWEPWNSARLGSVQPFVEAVRALGGPVVWDWGFPPEHLSLVRRLKEAGVEVWWFNADHAAARRAFFARATVSVKRFDIQIRKIEEAWPSIQDVFQPHMLETLGPDDARRTPDDTWRLMGGGM